MKWNKLGHIFVADNQYDWMATHAALPFPVLMDGDTYRIYFTCRNAQRRSHCGYAVVDIRTLSVLDISSKPLLSPGKPGYFDDAGALLTQIVPHKEGYFAYYVGWSERVSVPFQNAIGLAVSSDLIEFKKYADAPILDRSHNDPLNLSYPWVIKENAVWKMWYGSHLAWEKNGMDMQHVIKYAESEDGIHWQRSNITCINLHPDESGISRPCVIHADGQYHMWYSRRLGRKETYMLGYAISEDGKHWERRDETAGIAASPSPADWDGEMICYPCVFDHKGTRYMLYNGNGFGRTGFGLAVLD